MNPIAEEIYLYLEDDDQAAKHYGMPRRSGRYPWGSGEDPYQHNSGNLASRVESMKKDGMTESEIAKSMNTTVTSLRAQVALVKAEMHDYDVARAKSLAKRGKGATEIGRMMGQSESTIRGWLKEEGNARTKAAMATANFLKAKCDEHGMIDVGKGVEIDLNITSEKLKQALSILKEEGYNVYGGRTDQVTNPGKKTTMSVLCAPGVEHKDIFDTSKIGSIKEYSSEDNGETYRKFEYPSSMDSKRLMIRYAEEGGKDRDGIIELRRGVDDLYLGDGKRYSQVRILVDGTHYLKGMAVYADDLPDGVDVRFNTNKHVGTDMKDVLKKIKDDPENPFGSLIGPKGQSHYIDADGNEKLSLINKRADQGDWSEWKDALPSQFLSKQSKELAKQQLKIAEDNKKSEYEMIMEVNNPTVKKKLLNDFAESCDASSIQLKAAALPGQKYHVIIPINSLKDNEIYAPQYPDGSKLALIRYPHGGTFEIPICTVNNRNKLGSEIIGKQSHDAVGITSAVAERLSGADFDGDTVMCIPTHNGKVKIASQDSLEGLTNYEPKDLYRYSKIEKDAKGVEHYYRADGTEFKPMAKGSVQTEMGKISNLITDMTLLGASNDELARAVRHSMTVIDAHKHGLDYKKSEKDNNISELRKLYQPKFDEDGNPLKAGGAATLISRAKGQWTVEKRQGQPKVNIEGTDWYDPSRPEGSLLYKTADDANRLKVDKKVDKNGIATIKTADGGSIKYDTNNESDRMKYSIRKYVDPDNGEVRFTNADGSIEYKSLGRTQKSTRMAETDDARTLISEANTIMENIYASYANSMKSMANKARVVAYGTGKIAYSPDAKKAYIDEVKSLDEKLKRSESNAPRERQAQYLANAKLKEKKAEAGGKLSKEDEKKIAQKALSQYRDQVGAKRIPIDITDREWEAIQKGAISEAKLTRILKYADSDRVRELATPRAKNTVSPNIERRIASLKNSNYTLAEIARMLGVSTSTVNRYINPSSK